MHMIRHEAICPYRHVGTAAPLSHEPDVGFVILITKEHPLTTIPSLRYMMWSSRSYYSRESSHDPRIPEVLFQITNYVWCPRNSPNYVWCPRNSPEFNQAPGFKFRKSRDTIHILVGLQTSLSGPGFSPRIDMPNADSSHPRSFPAVPVTAAETILC
jgi:hypothetical protein